MGTYINSRVPFDLYNATAASRYFVDKSNLLKELIPMIGTTGRYLCITRPRRFGKSVMAGMVGAFFEKNVDGQDIFGKLNISECEDCYRHMNQHDVIYIDFSKMPRDCNSYEEYIARLEDGLNYDLAEAYPEFEVDIKGAVWDNIQKIYEKKACKFIFVIDEWDSIFHKDFIRAIDKKRYLDFLRNLLKDQGYVELVYMTGVLPIVKYSSGSELNMFMEYDMATKERFGEYFGFTEDEVDRLYEVYMGFEKRAAISREDLRDWYDGYHNALGERVYNPRSIDCALTNNQLGNYWTSSGPYDEIFYYIRNNIEDVRDDLVVMISGEGVEANIQNYSAVDMNLETRDEIYSAMVVYGLLTYEEGEVFIPNLEIMGQFQKLLMSKDSLGYVYRLAKESEKMLKATLTGDTKTMVDILQYAHNTESPILSYNNEIELSSIVNLVYLAARDKYRVEREDKAGKGYVDFIFYPVYKKADAFILELKVDAEPEEAIQQIKDKCYVLCLKGKLGEKPKYCGRILAVGISYHTKTKEHFCKIEEL